MTVEEENVKKEYFKQRYEELALYIDSLFQRVDIEIKDSNRVAKLDLATILLFFLTMFMGPDGTHEAAETLLYAQLLFGHLLFHQKVLRTMREIDGCFKCMEILGLIEKIDDDNEPRKRKRLKIKRESWVAKMWEALKIKQQQEAYA